MDKPFSAYSGDEPYIFVSYAHADADRVYSEIRWLHEQGFNVWYDEGIKPGSVWREELAKAIDGAAMFLFFVTPASITRPNCLREVGYAVDHEFPFLAIHLEETELDAATKLTLSSIQALHRFETAEREYRSKLITFASQHLARGVAVSALREPKRSRGKTLQLALVFTLLGAVLAVPGVVALLPAANQIPTSKSTINRLVPLPSSEFYVWYALISDEGNHVLLVGGDEDEPELWVWDRTQFAPTRVDVDGARAASAFLSPDGAWLGYEDSRDGEIKRTLVAGGRPIKIGSSGLAPGRGDQFGYNWASNGEIYFANIAHRGIQSIADTGGVRSAVTNPPEGFQDRTPRFIPHLGVLLFTRYEGSTRSSRIMVRDFDSGEEFELVEGGIPSVVGSFLVYHYEGAPWVAEVDWDRRVVIKKNVVPGESSSYFVTSSSGARLYPRPMADAQHSLVLVDARTGIERTIPGLGSGRFWTPAFSPDASTIAYAHDDLGGATDLWTIELASGHRRRLTNDDFTRYLPQWNPAGTEIAYRRSEAGTTSIVKRAASGSGEPITIVEAVGARPSEWTHDNKIIYTDGDDDDLRKVHASDGSPPETVLATEFVEVAGVLSKDGTRLAFETNRTGDYEIFVQPYPAAGAEPTQVSMGGGVRPRWSKVDKDVLYYRATKRLASIIRLRVDDVDDEFRVVSREVVFEGRPYVRTGSGRNYDISATDDFVFVKNTTDELPSFAFVEGWDLVLARAMED